MIKGDGSLVTAECELVFMMIESRGTSIVVAVVFLVADCNKSAVKFEK